jgi:hypothetical protein
VQATVEPFEDLYDCVSFDGNCEDAFTGIGSLFNPGLALPGMIEGLFGRVSEISSDFTNGREAQGTGKVVFDLALALAAKKVVKLPPCRGHSFVAGTLVVASNGRAVPINQLQVGDQVLATDPETGETAIKEVTDTIIGQGSKNLVKITVDADGTDRAGASVTATDIHPFWVPELRKWVHAAELKPGQWLRTSAGTHVQVTAVEAGRRWRRCST